MRAMTDQDQEAILELCVAAAFADGAKDQLLARVRRTTWPSG